MPSIIIPTSRHHLLEQIGLLKDILRRKRKCRRVLHPLQRASEIGHGNGRRKGGPRERNRFGERKEWSEKTPVEKRKSACGQNDVDMKKVGKWVVHFRVSILLHENESVHVAHTREVRAHHGHEEKLDACLVCHALALHALDALPDEWEQVEKEGVVGADVLADALLVAPEVEVAWEWGGVKIIRWRVVKFT